MLEPEPPIKLTFEKFSAFVEDYAAYLSLGGMFMCTDEVRPVGSIVDFEVVLTDGFRLVKGLGQVLWIRPEDVDADHPRGMAVRFQELDEKGRELFLKILEEHVRDGGQPFNVEEFPEGVLSTRGSLPDLSSAREGRATAASPAPPTPAAPAPPAPASPEPAESSPASPSPAAPQPAGDAAESGEMAAIPLAPRPATPGTEQKILGEDGFTLLEAEDEPEPPPSSEPKQRSFHELSFDAPWGKNLPEVPMEVLAEDGSAEPAPASPAPGSSSPASSGSSSSTSSTSSASSAPSDPEATPSVDPTAAPTGAPVGAESPEPVTAGIDEEDFPVAFATDPEEPSGAEPFLMVEEAAEDIALAPPSADAEQPDFGSIDFSVPDLPGDALEPEFGDDAANEVVFDAFEPDPDDQLPAPAAAADDEPPLFATDPTDGEPPLFATDPTAAEPPILDAELDEDPTLLSSPSDPLPSFETGLESEDPTLLSAPGSAEESAFAVVPAVDDPAPGSGVADDIWASDEMDGEEAAAPQATVPAAPARSIPERPSFFGSSGDFEEDPTTSTGGAPAAGASGFTAPEAAEPTTEQDPGAAAMAAEDAWQGEPVVTPGEVAASDLGEIQDYEDDLFDDGAGAGPGQAWRNAFGSRSLAVVVLVLVALGAAYAFRGPLAEMVGLGATAADVVPQPSALPEAPLETPGGEPSAAGEGISSPAEAAAGSEVEPPASFEEVDVAESHLPTGVDVSADPAAEEMPDTPPVTDALRGTSSSPATRVDRLSWRQGGGGTTLTVELNGNLETRRFAHLRLEYSDVREMVKISGIVEPYTSGRLEVATPEVQQVRVGFHEGNEVHIVLDFPSSASRISEVRNLGDRLEIQVIR